MTSSEKHGGILLINFNLPDQYVEKIRREAGELEVINTTDTAEHLRAASNTVILFGSSAPSQFIQTSNRLKWVQTPAVGADRVLSYFSSRPEVVITCTRGIHAGQVSDHVLALILAELRRLPEILNAQASKKWRALHPFAKEPLEEAAGKTVGIVGLGSIGSEIAKKCKCLGMRVLAVKRTPTAKPDFVDALFSSAELATVLPETDFLVLTAPLTSHTVNLMNERTLRLMKKRSYLINVARGELVDEDALVKSLGSGHLAGAALDVFREEPLPQTSPLWSLESVIVTPHVAGSSPAYWPRATDAFLSNLKHFLSNEPLENVVDRERGY